MFSSSMIWTGLRRDQVQDRQPTVLALERGETRCILVKARMTVLVVSGSIAVRGPLDWLAENILATEQHLFEEQVLELASGGWIDLRAGNGAKVILIPSERPRLWRQVARCIDYLQGKGSTRKPISR